MPDCFNNDLPPPPPPAVAVQSNNEFRFQSVSGSPAFGSTGPWCSRRFLTCVLLLFTFVSRVLQCSF